MAAHFKTAPPWASWSLVRSIQEERAAADAAAASTSVAGPSRIQLGDSEYKESGGAPSQVATLLSHDGDGHDAIWQDFSEERSRAAGQQPGMSGLGSANLPIDAEEMDRLLAPSRPLRTVKAEKDDGSGEENMTQEKGRLSSKGKHTGKSDAQTWRFDPLSEAESSALERALRISKYMPIGGDAEDALDAGDVIEKDSARGGKIRYHKETGRRVYTSIRGTTMIANREAQENLRQLCSLMLPQRNFDWILAQLSYPDTDMIRVPRELLVKAGQKAKISEAIKHVNESTLPLENAAIVMYVLARASGAQFSQDVGIVDPYAATARYRGRPTREARERMSAQSNAIVSVFRELFPSHFAHEQEARSASPIVREAYARLQNVKAVGDVKAKTNKVRGRGLVLDDESDEESDSGQRLYVGRDRGTSEENNSNEGSEDDAGDVGAMIEDVVDSAERSSTGQPKREDDREKGVLQPYQSNIPGGIMGWLRGPKKGIGKGNLAVQTTKADDVQAEMVVSKSVANTNATQRKRKRESSDATASKSPATTRKFAKQAAEKQEASPASEAKAKATTDANRPSPDPSPHTPSQDPRSSPIRRSRRGDGTASDFKMPLPSFWQKAKK